MQYIKDLVISETNKHLKSDMNMSDYFCVIGCRLIMDCYVGHYVIELFLKDIITPQKGAPSASTTSSLGGALIRSLRLCLTQILQFLSSMSWIFCAIWYGRWLIKHLIKRQRLGGVM